MVAQNGSLWCWQHSGMWVHKVSQTIPDMGMSNCKPSSKRYRYSFSTHTLELNFVDAHNVKNANKQNNTKNATLIRHGSGSYIQYFLSSPAMIFSKRKSYQICKFVGNKINDMNHYSFWHFFGCPIFIWITCKLSTSQTLNNTTVQYLKSLPTYIHTFLMFGGRSVALCWSSPIFAA